MKEYSRRDERIHLMQSFYQVFLFIENKEDYDATEILCLSYDVDEYDECPVYSELVYALGLSHFDEIKKELQKHLVNWTFDRLDHFAKGILFVAYTEGVYVKKAPRKVIINEAVALAKNFLKANDYKFINAVLDKAIPVE